MTKKSSISAPFYLPRKWEGFAAAVSGFVVYLTFAYFGDEARGTVAGAFFGALALAIRFCWPLRAQMWYIIEFVAVIAIHAALLLAFTWSFASHWSGLVVMPFMAADFLLIMLSIFLTYVKMHGQPVKLFIEL